MRVSHSSCEFFCCLFSFLFSRKKFIFFLLTTLSLTTLSLSCFLLLAPSLSSKNNNNKNMDPHSPNPGADHMRGTGALFFGGVGDPDLALCSFLCPCILFGCNERHIECVLNFFFYCYFILFSLVFLCCLV